VVVCPHQIDLGEEATTRELVGIIMYVTDGIAVGDGSGVQRCSHRRDANRCPSWAPYVEQRISTFQSGEMCRPATWRRTRLWRQRAGPVPVDVIGRWACCSPDVVDGVVAHLALDTRGANVVRKFGDEGADRSTAADNVDAGDLRGVVGSCNADVRLR
jgi:hypothetical protein